MAPGNKFLNDLEYRRFEEAVGSGSWGKGIKSTAEFVRVLESRERRCLGPMPSSFDIASTEEHSGPRFFLNEQGGGR